MKYHNLGIVSLGIGAIAGSYATYKLVKHGYKIIKKMQYLRRKYLDSVQMYLFINNMTIVLRDKHNSNYMFNRAFVGMNHKNRVIRDLMKVRKEYENNQSTEHIAKIIEPLLNKIGNKYNNKNFSAFLSCIYQAMLHNVESQKISMLCNKYNRWFKKFVIRYDNVADKASWAKFLLA